MVPPQPQQPHGLYLSFLALTFHREAPTPPVFTILSICQLFQASTAIPDERGGLIKGWH